MHATALFLYICITSLVFACLDGPCPEPRYDNDKSYYSAMNNMVRISISPAQQGEFGERRIFRPVQRSGVRNTKHSPAEGVLGYSTR